MTTIEISTDVEQAYPGFHKAHHRRHSKIPPVASRPFVGRIGGNQEFISSTKNSSDVKIPDAGATFTWAQSFHLRTFTNAEIWKGAVIEGVGTCLQIYLSGLISVGLGPLLQATSIGPVTPAAFGSISNGILVSLFIFGAGPVSGGHFNPLITMATFAARLSVFSRTLLYILFQCAGAVSAGALVRASLGVSSGEVSLIPGCYVDTSLVTPAEAYVLEMMSSYVLIFIAFGVGLDPRQREVLGPALSPILIGLAIAVCGFASGIARPGYSGAAMNPARCLGLMTTSGKFDYHYIHWVGAITTAILNGLLYWLVPIYEEPKKKSGK